VPGSTPMFTFTVCIFPGGAVRWLYGDVGWFDASSSFVRVLVVATHDCAAGMVGVLTGLVHGLGVCGCLGGVTLAGGCTSSQLAFKCRRSMAGDAPSLRQPCRPGVCDAGQHSRCARVRLAVLVGWPCLLVCAGYTAAPDV